VCIIIKETIGLGLLYTSKFLVLTYAVSLIYAKFFLNIYKYHLSLINLRDRIELWTEVDDHCNKLSVDSRGSGGVVNLVD